MYDFTRELIDLDAIRARIARMSADELRRYGEAAAWMAGAARARRGAYNWRKPGPSGAACRRRDWTEVNLPSIIPMPQGQSGQGDRAVMLMKLFACNPAMSSQSPRMLGVELFERRLTCRVDVI
jgi:hypothetical protein